MSRVIKVKIANNYETDPNLAATNYLEDNYEQAYQIPEVVPGSWKINDTINLQEGFAAYAQVAGITPPTYVGFQVCFLKNQETGFTTLYKDHLNVLSGSGAISSGYYGTYLAETEQDIGNFISNPVAGSIENMGMFLHPAYLARKDLNNASLNDQFFMNFVYQSPIFQSQPNKYLNDTDPTIDAPSKVLNTSRRTDTNYPLAVGSPATITTAQGAYGDNPWPKCSMTSFYTSNYIGIDQDFTDPVAIKSAQKTVTAQCAAEQDASWDAQWKAINPEEGGGA
jgi:hypothetical protein